jgi:hypothetical protein
MAASTTDCRPHCGVTAIDCTSGGKTGASSVSFRVLTNPSLVLRRLRGRVVKDVKVEEGEGGAGGRVERRGGGGRRGGRGRFERRGGGGRERVVKVGRAR